MYYETGVGIICPRQSPKEEQQTRQACSFFETCDFLYSAEELRHHPVNDHTVPEIVVLGASNVGKSTILNKLFNKKGVARVSKEPGKTTLLNAYGVGRPLVYGPKTPGEGPKLEKYGLVLMDSPGYGFGSRKEWGENILVYLEKRKALRGALLLLSAEKKFMSEDRWILRQLAQASAKITVVLTKADKVGWAWERKCQQLADSIREEADDLQVTMNTKIVLTIHVTSANQARGGIQGGIGGLRLAIMDMAGISVGTDKVEQAKENIKYSGEVVSFDDIKWK